MSADTLLVVVNLFNLKRMLGPEATKSLCCQFRYILFTQKRKFGEKADLGEELHQLSEFADGASEQCSACTELHMEEKKQLCIHPRQINASVVYPSILSNQTDFGYFLHCHNGNF